MKPWQIFKMSFGEQSKEVEFLSWGMIGKWWCLKVTVLFQQTILCSKSPFLGGLMRFQMHTYSSNMKSMTMFGAECCQWLWNMNKHCTAGMLHWTFGLTCMDHVTNMEVQKMMGIAPITEDAQNMWWYGYVLRSGENLATKITPYLNLDGRQPCDLPKKWWMDF